VIVEIKLYKIKNK